MADYVASELEARADPIAATAMAAYMKTDMPFYGVKTPDRRPILREVLRRYPVASKSAYRKAVLVLWNLPHREEKYLAIGVAGAYTDFITMDAVPLYRKLVIEGGWWDFVDGIAADLVGRVALQERADMAPVLDRWIDDPNLWIRRSAILAQLRHKDATDQARLFTYCLQRAHEREFFIRKAIGWALRQYARTEPEAVRRFVLANREVWSGLTYREATKHLDVPPQ